MEKPNQPPDDPSSAPESGTVRDDSNMKSSPPDRGTAQQSGKDRPTAGKDAPSTANEEK